MRIRAPRSTIGDMRERERAQLPVPERGLDRVLLGLGAAALIAVVPIVWIWLVYGSGFAGSSLWAAAVCLCVLVAGIGAAMIRLLDEGR
jgi:hypothetical protein